MSVSDLSRLLVRSPYRLIVGPKEKASDPIRFFRGAPASLAELQAGWGILRSLYRRTQIECFETFAEEYCNAGSGKVFILRAETGEGKTTFLRQLALHLEPAVRVLLWKKLQGHEPGLLRDLQKDRTRLVVVVELSSDLSSEAIGHFAATVTQDSLPCPLLVAAAPSELAHCHIPGVERMRFAPLGMESSVQLVEQLGKVLSLARETGVRIEEDLPNLGQFVASPDLKVFSEGPLLVSLLKATYGIDFRTRIAEEYNRLGREDILAQKIYRYACYVHAVGLQLPVEFLHRLVSEENLLTILSKFSGGSPWELLGDEDEDILTTRNPIIAQTVLIETGLLQRVFFRQFLNELFAAVEDPDVDAIRLVRSLVSGYAKWTPVGGVLRSDVRGILRKEMRSAVKAHKEWFGTARRIVVNSDDWGLAGSWGSFMYHILPEGWRQNPEVGYLVNENQAWLEVARHLYPPSLLPQLDYLGWKTRFIDSIIHDRVSEIRPQVLSAWQKLVGNALLGSDFYFDLAVIAFEQAKSSPKKDEFARWSQLAARAFEHLLSLRESSNAEVKRMYSKLLRQSCGTLSPEMFRDLLRVAWDVSVKLDSPNPRTGTWFAQELRKVDDEESQKVLKKVLANSCWGEALLELAQTAGDDHDLQEYILEIVKRHEIPLAWGSPLNTALACHAVGLTCGYRKVGKEQAVWLGKACDNYELAATADLGAMWPVHGEKSWHEAISRLRSVDSLAGKNRIKEWEKANTERLANWEQRWTRS